MRLGLARTADSEGAMCSRRSPVGLQPPVNGPLPGSPLNGGPACLLVFINICRQSLRVQFLDMEV